MLIIAVFINGNIAKSKFIEICTYGNGSMILDELIKSDILEEVSPTEVRLKVNLDQNKDMIKDIAGDNFDEVWGILHQSLIDGFYTFLRLTIFVTSIYLTFYFFSAGMNVWAWAIVLMALLFNPFIIVHLEKEIWRIVDFISVAVLGFIIIPARVKPYQLSILYIIASFIIVMLLTKGDRLWQWFFNH